MINTFSELENAVKAIPDFCRQEEQDVFVVHVKCKSCEEWSLRLRNQIFDEDSPCIAHKYYLPINHRFKDRENAQREADIWSQRLGKYVGLERHIKTEKGYKIFSHYSLKILSCLI